ncbi:MAG TPA: alpha/beta fold hydrolase [Phycisphaerales bacterium]|nr:alpha/beta fold hydrolase [Phycisphaerales bacterium]
MNATVQGIHLHYEVHGAGRPILLVHGFPLSSQMWTPIVQRLKSRYRMIVPDVRGHGLSESSPKTSITQMADDLAAILDRVNERNPVVVVGLSMGGYIALEFFRRHRPRVRGLVLADTRAAADSPEKARERALIAQRVLAEGSLVLAESMTNKLFAPDAPADMKEVWKERISHAKPEGVAAALTAMAQREDSIALLPTIDVPTLVIVGEHDAITPVDEVRAMQQSIPGSELVVVPGAGHLSPVEQPDRVAEALKQFMARVKGASPEPAHLV